MSRRIALSRRVKDLEVRAEAALARRRCQTCAARGLTTITVHERVAEEPAKLPPHPRCPQCSRPIEMLVIRVVPSPPPPPDPHFWD